MDPKGRQPIKVALLMLPSKPEFYFRTILLEAGGMSLMFVDVVPLAYTISFFNSLLRKI